MSARRLAICAFLMIGGATAHGQSNLFEIDGLHIPGWFSDNDMGTSVAHIGDINGDGHDDVLIGVPGFLLINDFIGAAQIFSGASGLVLQYSPGDPVDGNRRLGTSVAGVGDVDGDGIPDFVAGDPAANAGGFNAGQIKVFRGSNGTVLHVLNGSTGDELGRSVAGIDDVTGDGVPDIIASAPRAAAGGLGSVCVFSGRTGNKLRDYPSPSAQRIFGWSVDSAGDVNSDGVEDVLIGAPGRTTSDDGWALVYSGASDKLLLRLGIGTSAFGLSVAGLEGDVTGDGVWDYAVGDPDASLASQRLGSVTVYSGGSGAVHNILWGAQANAAYGTSVDGAGDVDGDGRNDVIVGEKFFITNTGKVGRTSVRTAAGVTLYNTYGNTELGGFGQSVAGVGDTDNDGLPDFAVGAPDELSSEDRFGGSVHVYGSGPILLDFRQDWIARWDRIDINARNGNPSAPFLLVVTAVNDVPLFANVLLGRFNASGNWSATFTSELDTDLDLALTLYSVGPTGHGAQASNSEHVRFIAR